MVSLQSLKIVRELLAKALKLLDAEISREESKDDGCPHTDHVELSTMGMQGTQIICNTCGEKFTKEEEGENDRPGVLEGRLRPRPKQGRRGTA